MSWQTRMSAKANISHYARKDVCHRIKGSSSVADRRTLTIVPFSIAIDDRAGAGRLDIFTIESDTDFDLNTAATWDNIATDYTVAANRAGKDFSYYACIQAGTTPKILVSVNASAPSGYTTTNSRKIGQFHCLCLDAGTISGHALTGFLTGDILPRSIQDVLHRPKTGFINGMVWCGASPSDSNNYGDFWKSIYIVSGGSSPVSAFGGTISHSITWQNWTVYLAKVGCRLPRDWEWGTSAQGCEGGYNIAGRADPVTSGGHLNENGTRILSNVGSEDDCGVSNQWIDEQSFELEFDATFEDSDDTTTVHHSAAPPGALVYVKHNPTRLVANVLADTYVTFGTRRVYIFADADPSTGGSQLYIDDDYSYDWDQKFTTTSAFGASVYVPTHVPHFYMSIKHRSNPATYGTAVYVDANALYSTLAGAANTTSSLVVSPGWSHSTDANGGVYHQGEWGVVKGLAGGHWNSTGPGPKMRWWHHSGERTGIDICCRMVADPV